MRFSNCCDFVASSLDEIEASRKTGIKPGSKCTNMDDDGQLKVYSLQSSEFLERLSEHLQAKGHFVPLDRSPSGPPY